MRAIATTSNSISNGSTMSSSGITSSFWHWKSPVPYLFGSLALMLTLITVALVFLICSFHKRSSSSSSSSPTDEEKSAYISDHKTTHDEEMTPKIVVIMAGDQKPTHLAIPISSSLISTSK
ncbi:hypothetical protein HAX54_036912 [Datura stramonium]|uniref:Uncharacterized protein n=1 Tax=Datura stramonium TaxID=4076 RepID=A0ABS8VLH2_DATST|nr:hypothetical protein [Datura stramonium]